MRYDDVCCRCMLGWCQLPMARAYAYTLYLDEDALFILRRLDMRNPREDSSASWFGGTSPSSEHLQALLDCKIVRPQLCELSIVLRMARDIDGPHIAKGFRNSLRNVLQQAAQAAPNPETVEDTDMAPTSELSILEPSATLVAQLRAGDPSKHLLEIEDFVRPIERIEWAAGDELQLTWGRDGKLTVLARGERLTEEPIDSPALTRALFDLYTSESFAVSAAGTRLLSDNALAMSRAIGLGRPVDEAYFFDDSDEEER